MIHAQNDRHENKKLPERFMVMDSIKFEALRSQILNALSLPVNEVPIWNPEFYQVLENAKGWAYNHGNEVQKSMSEFFILMYYDKSIYDDKVIELGKKLLQDSILMKTSESGLVLSALNSSYNRKGQYLKQLAILEKLIKFNKEFGESVAPQTYAYYNQMGLIYYRLEHYQLARRNFRRQAKIFLESGDLFQASSMLNNIGLTFNREEQTDSALKYYKKALRLANDMRDRPNNPAKAYHLHFQNVISANIEQIRMNQGKFDKAEQVFQKELASSKQVREFSTAAQAYEKISRYYYLRQQYDLATIYNDSCLYFEKNFYNPSNRQKALLLRAKILLKTHKNDSVLSYIEEANRLEDSLIKEEKRKNYMEATSKFNFTQSEEALKINRELLAQKDKNAQLQWIITGFSIGLLLLMGHLFFKTKRANSIINTQKTALTRGIREKEIMLDEIQHRTKNNLQMISGILEIQKQKHELSENSILQTSQEYLQSMFMIHELLYEQDKGLDVLDMHAYFHRMANFLINNYPALEVEWKINTTLTLDVKTATPLGLMVCELIINSLKHAFTQGGKIDISLTKTRSNYRLIYSDNGKGFLQKNNPDSFNTGMNLIFMLAEDLSGVIVLPDSPGFCLQLDFNTA